MYIYIGVKYQRAANCSELYNSIAQCVHLSQYCKELFTIYLNTIFYSQSSMIFLPPCHEVMLNLCLNLTTIK